MDWSPPDHCKSPKDHSIADQSGALHIHTSQPQLSISVNLHPNALGSTRTKQQPPGSLLRMLQLRPTLFYHSVSVIIAFCASGEQTQLEVLQLHHQPVVVQQLPPLFPQLQIAHHCPNCKIKIFRKTDALNTLRLFSCHYSPYNVA